MTSDGTNTASWQTQDQILLLYFTVSQGNVNISFHEKHNNSAKMFSKVFFLQASCVPDLLHYQPVALEGSALYFLSH